MQNDLYAIPKTDVPKLVELWNAAAPHDQLSQSTLIEKTFGDPRFAPELCYVSKCPDGVIDGFIASVATRIGQASAVCIKMVAVRAPRQRLGIGRVLVRRVESIASELGVLQVRVGEGSPNYLTPGIDSRYTDAIGFFTNMDYRVTGETHDMQCDLNQPFDTAADEIALVESQSVVIRRAKESDQKGVVQFLQARWPPWIAEVMQAFRQNPISLHLAEKDGVIQAFSAYDCNNFGTGWFGPMGTDESVRGLGIGAILCKRCLNDIRNQGHPSATIPWVGPISFYENAVDAKVSRKYIRMKKSLEQI